MSLKFDEPSLAMQIARLQKEAAKNRWSQATYDRKLAELTGQPDPGTKRTFWDNLLGRK